VAIAVPRELASGVAARDSPAGGVLVSECTRRADAPGIDYRRVDTRLALLVAALKRVRQTRSPAGHRRRPAGHRQIAPARRAGPAGAHGCWPVARSRPGRSGELLGGRRDRQGPRRHPGEQLARRGRRQARRARARHGQRRHKELV